MTIPFSDICIRLLVATLFASIIGWEREFKTHSAGLRTHILVCVVSTIISMVQEQLMFQSLQIASAYPNLSNVVGCDPARLICQVISGIGFLGAGTIVITKSSIRGLTTAASLWATAVLGLAVGMGFYIIAMLGAIFIFLSLTLVKKIETLPSMLLPSIKQVEIQYYHKETKESIERYFSDNYIKIRSTNFSVAFDKNSRLYIVDYTIELPKAMTYIKMAEDLAEYKDIIQIHLVTL